MKIKKGIQKVELKDYLGADNTLGMDIWENKYRFNGESFDQFVERVSGGDAAVADLIYQKKFIFAGRILANRGLHKYGKKVTYSNCYVVSAPDDSLESIFETAKALARTYSYGGGCGVDIGKLRPRGAKVNNAAKTTSGSTSFMQLFSMVTEIIGQNGRRGALMITIPCSHPDLADFIDIKSDLTKVTKANISVRITDEFMHAVENHKNYLLKFTVQDTGEVIQKEIDAYAMFAHLAEMNWDYAEPGMLFWDRISSWNLLANTKDFEFAGTNPCAEEPLPAGGSCLLGTINLSAYVKNGSFDYETFSGDVKTSVTALNDVLDEGLPLHPLPEQRESVKNWRQIGLGVLGIADMLIKLGIRYGSPEAVELSDKVGRTMINSALVRSAELAAEKEPFPKCRLEEIISTPFFIENADEETVNIVKKCGGLRNSQLLTIAPTGSISTMLGISGGIEPIFSISYTRKTESLHGEPVYYKVFAKIVQDYMEAHNIEVEQELPDFFVTAGNLDYRERIAMQAVWQKHIDASISSTVNVPNSFTKEDTENLYISAWKAGLKGVTIFRDGCRRTGILTHEEPGSEKDGTPSRGEIVRISDQLIGKKRTLHTGCGTLHCEAFFNPETGKLMENFLTKGSKGGCNSFMVGLSRMISIAARGGVSIDDIVDQLESTIDCPSYIVRTALRRDTSPGSSCPKAVGIALTDMYEEMQKELKGIPVAKMREEIREKVSEEKTAVACPECSGIKNPCPVCGQELSFEGGCNSCRNCGYSKCE
jgi:ribonucleoside-diphosphate reductase alpha chain